MISGWTSDVTAGFPQNECFQESKGSRKTNFDLASEVTWYHFYLMLGSQNLLRIKSKLKGRSIHIGRRGSLGASLVLTWCYTTGNLIIFYTSLLFPHYATKSFYIWFWFFGQVIKDPPPPPPSAPREVSECLISDVGVFLCMKVLSPNLTNYIIVE